MIETRGVARLARLATPRLGGRAPGMNRDGAAGGMSTTGRSIPELLDLNSPPQAALTRR